MRRSIATITAAALGLAMLPQSAAHAAAPPDTATGRPADLLATAPAGNAGHRSPQSTGNLSAAARAALAAGVNAVPKAAYGHRPAGPNPLLANVPDASTVDYAGWRNYLKAQAPARAAARHKALAANPAATAPAVVVDEDEPAGTYGGNDKPGTAQRVTGFGTGSGQHAKLRVLGSLDSEPVNSRDVPPAAEDDGSIPLAGDSGISGLRNAVVIDGRIGDGPHGRETGDGRNDFDFVKVTVKAGKVLTVSTATPTGPLDTVLELFAPDGTLLAVNDDFTGVDSRISYPVTSDGDLYVAVAAYGGLPGDPFDSGSGNGQDAEQPPSEGPYALTVKAAGIDSDFFAVKLKAGDVLGASVRGSAAYLTVYDTVPREVHGSGQDPSAIFPMASPLPGGGNAATDYVATRSGWHYVAVTSGSGAYDITVEAYRRSGATQTLYLDFDGARVNTAVFGGKGNRELSPFAAFLARWGLSRTDEKALIDKVVASVTENIRDDMVASGQNKRFAIQIRNSRDNADPWGKANVSRVVVGGTTDQAGIDTIGIAQSIDPGNFETQETALVLLDVLSAPADDSTATLNAYLAPTSNRIAFLGRALGAVISHEAGHLFGDYHTDNQDTAVNLMDAGGVGFAALYGVGRDGVGGTADDVDVDFGEDIFLPDEGFTGIEDTLGRIAFGLTS